MPDIFLSYARDDRTAVERLAALLEDLGYSVWWDKNLVGGERYPQEIEAALAGCKCVIVAWSAASVKSMWVADEAAVGRNDGKLIPICLDAAAPPIGFRQIQAIDFREWRGDKKAPPVTALTKAIAQMAGKGGEEKSSAPIASAIKNAPALYNISASRKDFVRFAGVAVVALALIAAAVFSYAPLFGPNGQSTISSVQAGRAIAVMPFAFKGPGDDLSGVAEGLTFSVRHHLRVAGFKIVGYDFPKNDNVDEMRRFVSSLGADYVLHGAVTEIGSSLLFNVSLVDAKTEQSTITIEHNAPNLADIDIVYRIVDMVVNKLAGGKTSKLDSITHNADYYWALGATSAISSIPNGAVNVGDLERAANVLEKAVEQDPSDGTAYVSLAYALASIDRQNGFSAEKRARAEEAVDNAFRTLGNDSDAHFAKAVLNYVYGDDDRRLMDAKRELQNALALDTQNFRALKWMSNVLFLQDDYEGAIKYSEAALEISPLYKQAQGNKISALLILGMREDAKKQIDEIIASDPEWGWALRFRASLELTQGDLVGAAKDVAAADRQEIVAAGEQIKSVIYANLGLLDEAREAIDKQSDNDSAAQLHWNNYKKKIIAGDIDGAMEELTALLATDDQSSLHSNALLASGYLLLYSGENKEAGKRCASSITTAEPARANDPPSLAETCLAIAWARLGDTHSAEQLLNAFESAAPTKGEAYQPYWNRSQVAALYAAIGDREKALDELRAMVGDGWRTPLTAVCRHCVHLALDDPNGLFSDYRDDPAFQSIMADVRDDLEAQRNELNR